MNNTIDNTTDYTTRRYYTSDEIYDAAYGYGLFVNDTNISSDLQILEVTVPNPAHCDTCSCDDSFKTLYELRSTDDGGSYTLYSAASDRFDALDGDEDLFEYYMNTNTDTRISCSICGYKIEPHPLSGWAEGHNADPVNSGRCCDNCNETVVVPKRIHEYMARPR